MRVTSGLYRGRLLLSPQDSNTTRPTGDKVKQAIFNSIGSKIIDSIFIDLFAGTGAIGIEALSRGAKKVFFNDHKSIETVSRNLKSLKIENQLIYNYDYLDALRKIKKLNIICDIVFIDPPYNFKSYQYIINYFVDNHLLSQDGIIIIESDIKKDIIDERFDSKSYLYNDTKITILRRKL